MDDMHQATQLGFVQPNDNGESVAVLLFYHMYVHE